MLYKYINDLTAVEKIAAGSLKFTPIDHLNDPMEMFPHFEKEAYVTSLRELRGRQLTKSDLDELRCQYFVLKEINPSLISFEVPENLEILKINLDRRVYEDINLMKNYFGEMVASIRKHLGVLSLTKRWKSMPMWAHYANNGSGACVGFQRLEHIYIGDETRRFNKVTPILYDSQPRMMTFEPKSDRNLYFYKHSDWSYEKEYRVIKPLKRCSHVGDGLYVDRLNSSVVKKVIFGWATPENLIKSTIEKVSVINNEVEFSQVYINSAGDILQNSL